MSKDGGVEKIRPKESEAESGQPPPTRLVHSEFVRPKSGHRGRPRPREDHPRERVRTDSESEEDDDSRKADSQRCGQDHPF